MDSLKCIYQGPIGGDCTSHNTYIPAKPITVAQLCQQILSNKSEWGYIAVDYRDFSIEYKYGNYVDKHGNVIECNLPEEIMNMQVRRVEWYGGWTLSNWHIIADNPNVVYINENF